MSLDERPALERLRELARAHFTADESELRVLIRAILVEGKAGGERRLQALRLDLAHPAVMPLFRVPPAPVSRYETSDHEVVLRVHQGSISKLFFDTEYSDGDLSSIIQKLFEEFDIQVPYLQKTKAWMPNAEYTNYGTDANALQHELTTHAVAQSKLRNGRSAYSLAAKLESRYRLPDAKELTSGELDQHPNSEMHWQRMPVPKKYGNLLNECIKLYPTQKNHVLKPESEPSVDSFDRTVQVALWLPSRIDNVIYDSKNRQLIIKYTSTAKRVRIRGLFDYTYEGEKHREFFLKQAEEGELIIHPSDLLDVANTGKPPSAVPLSQITWSLIVVYLEIADELIDWLALSGSDIKKTNAPRSGKALIIATTDAKYTQVDASLMEEMFKTWDYDITSILISNHAEYETRVIRFLSTLARKDKVAVYYSGHGFSHNADDIHFVIGGQGHSFFELAEQIQFRTKGEIVAYIDACRVKLCVASKRRKKMRRVFCSYACSPGERSWSYGILTSGYWTRCLYEAYKESLGQPLAAGELHNLAVKKDRQLKNAPKEHNKQTPTYIGNPRIKLVDQQGRPRYAIVFVLGGAAVLGFLFLGDNLQPRGQGTSKISSEVARQLTGSTTKVEEQLPQSSSDEVSSSEPEHGSRSQSVLFSPTLWLENVPNCEIGRIAYKPPAPTTQDEDKGLLVAKCSANQCFYADAPLTLSRVEKKQLCTLKTLSKIVLRPSAQGVAPHVSPHPPDSSLIEATKQVFQVVAIDRTTRVRKTKCN